MFKPSQLVRALGLTALVAALGCGSKSSAPAPTHSIGGSVTGLTASGLVLRNNGGDDLTLPPGATSYAFASRVAQGTPYAVTVKTQPAGLVCNVVNASGTVASADVADVNVSCSANTYTIGGAVHGLTATGLVLHSNVGIGEDLPVSSGAASYTFTAGAATGTAYAVSVKLQPAGLYCTVANASGTMGSVNVANADVTCSVAIQRWAAPTSWGGLWPASPTMVHHAHFDGSGIVEDAATGIGWTTVGGAPTIRALGAFPAGSRFGAGPFNAGQRYQATAGSDAALDPLTGNLLVCAVFKPDYNPTNTVPGGVDHERVILARGVGHDTNANPGGGWVLMQMHSYFCFHYEYMDSTGMSQAAMAIVPTYFADQNRLPSNGPLNPSYVVFCGGRDGNTLRSAVNSVLPTGAFAGSTMDLMGTGAIVLDKGTHPLTIGGYDATATDFANHVFGGRVYETAVWNEPATPENIQAKLAAIQGVSPGATYVRNREAWFTGADAAPHATYWDGPRIDPSLGFLFGLQGWNRLSRWTQTTISGNPDQVAAAGEDLALWTASGGATVAATGDVEPPGDSERASAKLVTIPPGGSLVTPLGAFDAAGPVHGQMWLRVPAVTAGTTLQLIMSAPATSGSSTFDVDLSTLTPNTWTRVWLRRDPGGPGNELTTNGAAGTLTLARGDAGANTVELYLWGIDLTQIGTLPTAQGSPGANLGVELGAFDPGQEMYDWSAKNATTGFDTAPTVDALLLPDVPVSTASAGFCLAVDASMPGAGSAALPWATPFTRPRTAVAWLSQPLSDAPTASARIYLDSAASTETPTPREICFAVGASSACAPVPASFLPGSTHTIKACMSPGGNLSLYADASTTPIATAASGIAAPDLSGGALLVGGARLQPVGDDNPWHGYISKAVVCHGGDVAACQ